MPKNSAANSLIKLPSNYSVMGQRVTKSDFEWTYTDQPHTNRRKEILEKYPQIKKLFGHDPAFKYEVAFRVFLQIVALYVLKDASWMTIFLAAYFFGGTINHSLTLAIHDISHNTAFGYSKPLHNRLFGMFANLPIGVPMSIAFKKYHIDHHRFLADEVLDTDVPTEMEAKLFCTTFGKCVWLFLQPLFYTFRPLIVSPKPFSNLEILNYVVQITFDLLVAYFCGWRMVGYLILGTFISMGFHPIAGHFISEHYMFKKGFETYSYYGPLNWITFNVGYHNEHHDFPNIPSSRLAEVKKIAPEYYDNLPQHHSWVKVLYDFIVDPEIGPYARIKRKTKAASIK